MRIILTGASGQVGKLLVPLLEAAGCDLLLAGRGERHLSEVFPGRKCIDYSGIESHGNGYDRIVHLAALNNNSAESLEAFRQANVGLSVSVARAAAAARVKRMYFISSFHALDKSVQSPYAITKREARNALRREKDIKTTVIYLPLVYGDSWLGSLKFLNRLPKIVSKILFSVLKSLKPTVNVSELVALISAPDSPEREDVMIVDPMERILVYRLFRMSIDFLAVVVLFPILLVLYPIVLVANIVEDGGGAFFRQLRVGKNGSIFQCLKFRSMALGTKSVPTHEQSARSVTKTGSFLRRWKFDEVPQVVNILFGQMTAIGPRPCLPTQTKLIELREKRGVLRSLPGVSGLAQVNGVDMSDPERLVQFEHDYQFKRCIILDLKIMLRTLRGGKVAEPTMTD